MQRYEKYLVLIIKFAVIFAHHIQLVSAILLLYFLDELYRSTILLIFI
ncbi:hypothetical protein CCAND93_220023 [Capnocytophaga canis]|uniref:Uncharacterized protein n=1 Tax=Capnocytophaga canis TaxID=1848903 RepID=A0A0B7IQD9_9FLAO|nr:hypothetical protein CCAND93_220023 [Capnocytophaga canis]